MRTSRDEEASAGRHRVAALSQPATRASPGPMPRRAVLRDAATAPDPGRRSLSVRHLCEPDSPDLGDLFRRGVGVSRSTRSGRGRSGVSERNLVVGRHDEVRGRTEIRDGSRSGLTEPGSKPLTQTAQTSYINDLSLRGLAGVRTRPGQAGPLNNPAGPSVRRGLSSSAHVRHPPAISQPRRASSIALSPCVPASLDEALPCRARASTPSRITAMRKSAKARWKGVIGSERPVRAW